MFIPTINVKRPDGTSFSVIGRLYADPMTKKTFNIIQHPQGQEGLFPPQIIAVLQEHWKHVVNFLKWIEINGNG